MVETQEENRFPAAWCGRTARKQRGSVITDDASSSLSSGNTGVLPAGPIIKGDKHEYRRRSTTYLSQQVVTVRRESASVHRSRHSPFQPWDLTAIRWTSTTRASSSHLGPLVTHIPVWIRDRSESSLLGSLAHNPSQTHVPRPPETIRSGKCCGVRARSDTPGKVT